MHELPGFAELGDAWIELQMASREFAHSPHGKDRAIAAARLKRAALAYGKRWESVLDTMRNGFSQDKEIGNGERE